MEQTVPDIDRLAFHLVEEIERCHARIMDLHGYASDGSYDTNLECAKLIARLMQSQVSAMMGVKRLCNDGAQHTSAHQGNTPTPENLKTNTPAASS